MRLPKNLYLYSGSYRSVWLAKSLKLGVRILKGILNIMRLFIILFITVISLSGFVFPCMAQSLFSGLILSEKKEGLKIVGIQTGSPGYESGLRTEDIIIEIEGKKVKTLPEYIKISRELKNKKVEAALVILRKGIEYDVSIAVYSMPIYKYWNEKVTKPTELPKGLTDTPYVYWVGKGYKAFKEISGKEPVDSQIENYNNALSSLLNALHYRPESIDAALQIASIYHKLGSLYVKKEVVLEGVKYYRRSMNYYEGCFKKTQKEDYLSKIFTNLLEIEKELSEINFNEVKPASETKRKSLRIIQ